MRLPVAAAAAACALFLFTGAATSNTVLQARKVDRFDAAKAFAFLRWQVELGPRPAGSETSRRLAARLRTELPAGRYQPVPVGLQNVVGIVPGRDRTRLVVVGAHYDTEELPGFVGANDGASGTAVVVQLARTLRPRTIRPSVAFILFDGEEDPPGSPNFEQYGLRGSKVAARAYSHAEAAIVIDMIGDRNLSIPREGLSDQRLWRRLRAAAGRVGAGWAFPAQTRTAILDDHLPFIRAGVPAIDLIDFTFDCWHQTCDDMSTVSPQSLDAVGETVLELLRTL
jgi:glutaminyl-peptide cyclotransferase